MARVEKSNIDTDHATSPRACVGKGDIGGRTHGEETAAETVFGNGPDTRCRDTETGAQKARLEALEIKVIKNGG